MHRFYFVLLVSLCFRLFAEDTSISMLSVDSCSTSLCHGGASEMRFQYQVWYEMDPHSKTYASLKSAWGKQIANTLAIKNPDRDFRCTTCHAPLREFEYPKEDVGLISSSSDKREWSDVVGCDEGIAIAMAEQNTTDERSQLSKLNEIKPILSKEGVSCVVCHGSPENWYYSHTREDYTHQERSTLGMFDLQDDYIKANTCVACHQHIDPALTDAGHPELVFELDRLTKNMPAHWQFKKDSESGKLWLLGQVVALRETRMLDQRTALLWLIRLVINNTCFTLTDEDALAVQIAHTSWSEDLNKTLFKNLIDIKNYNWQSLSSEEQFLCAQRLVLGLNVFIPQETAFLKELSSLVESREIFKPKAFLSILITKSSALLLRY